MYDVLAWMIYSLVVDGGTVDGFELLKEDADLVAVGSRAGVEEEWFGRHECFGYGSKTPQRTGSIYSVANEHVQVTRPQSELLSNESHQV